jgi:hypothetical protein
VKQVHRRFCVPVLRFPARKPNVSFKPPLHILRGISTAVVLAIASIVLFPLVARSEEMRPYPEQLVKEAQQLQLHRHKGWLALLHYGKTMSGTYRSKIDDKKFFLAPSGRVDAKAELEATLRSFFQVDAPDGLGGQCRFPARLAWLTEQLHIDAAQLPPMSCSERDKSLQAVEAQAAVLVFPVGHINSPASMFGHTLLRIDGSSKSNLISHAVNYSAYDTDTNGFLYAWNGLTGGYKGYYSLMPYYDKVREYNNLEHRDMWEYRLKLTPTEVKQMVAHIWELHKIESSYYFFDENCSYNLMFLVEVARPGVALTDKAGLFMVLPSDTVRIMAESNLLGEVTYRASQGTKIRATLSQLDARQQERAHDIAYQVTEPVSLRGEPDNAGEKIRMLELAANFVQYRFARKELEKDVYSRLYLKILGERSQLGRAPDDLNLIAEPVRPDLGHGTSKFSLAGGVHNGSVFTELNLRPQFHSLPDPDQGYLPGAQIKFLDTTVRYLPREEQLTLKSLQLLDILSIAPRDRFFKPMSWKVNTGLDTELLGDGGEYHVFRINSGGGFSSVSPLGGLWYAFAELDVNASSAFRAGVAAAPGLSVGTVEPLGSDTKLLLHASGFWYGAGDGRTAVKTTGTLTQRLSQNNSVSLEAGTVFVNSYSRAELALRWSCFY